MSTLAAPDEHKPQVKSLCELHQKAFLCLKAGHSETQSLSLQLKKSVCGRDCHETETCWI